MREVNRKNRKFFLVLLATGALIGLVMAQQDRKDLTGLPEGVRVLPSFVKPWHPHAVLRDGESYGILFDETSVINPPPKALWVHRVKRRMPSRRLEDVTAMAEKLGFTNEWKTIEKGFRSIVQKELGVLSYINKGVGCPLELSYRSQAYERADRVSNSEEYLAMKKRDFAPGEMYEIGRNTLERLGLWSCNLAGKYKWGEQDQGGGGWNVPSMICRDFYCDGEIEGYRMTSPRHWYRFSVSFTGEFGKFSIAWLETERFALLETIPVPEAFDALNKGYSLLLPSDVAGATAKYWGVVYIPGGADFEYVYPFYILDVESAGESFEAYVPAINSKYFQNPKQQIKVLPCPDGTTNIVVTSAKRQVHHNSVTEFRKTPDFLVTHSRAIVRGRLTHAVEQWEWRLTNVVEIAGKLDEVPIFYVGSETPRNHETVNVMEGSVGTTSVFFLDVLDDTHAVLCMRNEWFDVYRGTNSISKWQIAGTNYLKGSFASTPEDLSRDLERVVKERQQGHAE